MVNMKATSKRPKSKIKSIQLKRRIRKSRRNSSYSPHSSWSNFLDKDVPVRSLVKYSGITLAFVIVLLSVFLLGRVSVDSDDKVGSADDSMQLSGETKQTVKSGADKETATDSVETEEIEEEDIEVANLSDPEVDEQEYEYRVADDEDVEEDTETVVSSCTNTVAGFDYSYTNVDVDVSNFNKELKGDNWGSITSLKLTITNNEPCTIINPTKVKIKMNPKGKGSVWWDEDSFLPDTFRHMLPGATVSEIISVHVTYSDIYSEKDFRLTVVDDYDIPISTITEYMTLH